MIGLLRGEVFANRRNWRTLHTDGDASIDDQQEREDRKQSNAKDDRNGNRHEKLDEEVGHQRTLGSDNGRFLRHRPKRSGRCLNYVKLYQGHGPLPKSQGVPKALA